MNKLIALLSMGVMLVAGTTACSDGEGDGGGEFKQTGIELTAAESRAGEALVDFQHDFVVKTNSLTGADENMVCSPMSCSMLLSMLAECYEGATRDEITALLGFSDREVLRSHNKKISEVLPGLDKDVKYRQHNALWYSQSLQLSTGFSSVFSDTYSGEIFAYGDPSKARNDINEWVKKTTEGLIPSILDENPGEAVLANVLYFHGAWTDPFKTSETTSKTFHGLKVDAQVDMMHRKDEMLYYSSDYLPEQKDYTALKCTFGRQGQYCAYFILPNEGVDVNRLLESGVLEELGTLPFAMYSVDLELPRMDVSTPKALELTEIISEMGVPSLGKEGTTLFTPAIEVDVTVRQKTSIKFNEEGAEAAAVTWAGLVTSPGVAGSADFHLDRPFIFSIELTKTGDILFAGKITNL